MRKTISALLKQKSWTGKEVGYALLLSLANDIKNTGNPNKKPLFSQSDFNRMLESLSDEEQYTQFKVLESIYKSIAERFEYNETMKQQFYNGYYRFFLAIREAQRAESFYNTIEKFPLILTQSQYDKLASESRARKRAFNESFYSLFFHTVSFFIDAADHGEADAIPESIMAAITETKSQPVTNKRILANWAEDLGEGYYQLRDGRRSDGMSWDDWQAALESDFMTKHSYCINGKKQDYQTTAKYYHEMYLLEACKLLFKGDYYIRDSYKEKTGETLQEEKLSGVKRALEEFMDGAKEEDIPTAEDQIAKILLCGESDKYPEWHFYTPPDHISKHDILTEKETLGRYSGLHKSRLLENGVDHVSEIPEHEQFREFRKDYPVLTDAIKKYLRKKLPIKGLRVNQYHSPLITWGELADMGFLDFQDLTAVDDEDIINYLEKTQADSTETFNQWRRGSRHGIAILRTSNLFELGESGDYRDPVSDTRRKSELLQGLDYLEKDPGQADYIQNNLDILALPALRYMYAYNAFIEAITAAYDLDFLRIAKIDLTRQESQIDACNSLLYLLYKDVYGTERDRKRKRRFIKDFFQPIETEYLKPSKETTEILAESLKELGYTKDAALTIADHKSIISAILNEGGME